MEIWHRISFNVSGKKGFYKVVQNLDVISKIIELPGGGGMMVYVDIKESDPHWAIVSYWVMKTGSLDIKDTFFSDEEIRNAEWLRLISVFEQGYPQPKMEWPIKQLSYKIECYECGNYHQTNSMRMAKEPSLRSKSFMTLIWTNEILCIPEVIQGLGKIQAKGFEVWDALIHKTNSPSSKVQQLYIPGIAPPGVVIEPDLTGINCPVCGTPKYYAHTRGVMHLKREALLPDTDFMLTHERFGSGYIAWREIFVSNRVACLILDNGWKGVRFKVVEIVG